MIEIKVLASGSRGNCTALRSGSTTILLDAGILFSTIREALDFKNPAAALITHEHGDHARLSTIRELLKRGVDVFMTAGTAEALNLTKHHRLHLIEPYKQINLGNGLKMCAETNYHHDAAEPVHFRVWEFDAWRRIGDYVYYVTDTRSTPLTDNDPTTKLIIEANHCEGRVEQSDIPYNQKKRILNNHQSIETLALFLRISKLRRLREVHLIHVSKRHGDAVDFQRRVQAILPKVEVKAAW